MYVAVKMDKENHVKYIKYIFKKCNHAGLSKLTRVYVVVEVFSGGINSVVK